MVENEQHPNVAVKGVYAPPLRSHSDLVYCALVAVQVCCVFVGETEGVNVLFITLSVRGVAVGE